MNAKTNVIPITSAKAATFVGTDGGIVCKRHPEEPLWVHLGNTESGDAIVFLVCTQCGTRITELLARVENDGVPCLVVRGLYYED